MPKTGNTLPYSAGSKRQRTSTTTTTTELCSMCQTSLSNVVVGLPMGRRLVKTPLCWLHYYTSRAVREPQQQVVVTSFAPDDDIQTLFSEAFIELQQEFAEESARTFSIQNKNPLGIINSLRGKRKNQPSSSVPKATKQQLQLQLQQQQKLHDKDAGGFFKPIQLPERFQKTQRQLAQTTATAPPPPTTATSSIIDDGYGNPYRRRKGSKKSIWNMAMDDTQKSIKPTMEESHHATSICTCGSTKDVTSTGNITNRNNEMSKGETWGVKDGPNVVMRYQCNVCGKIWNEEE